jgi:hypothetical protein
MCRIDKQNGNVIDMVEYRGEPRFRALSQVEAYWDGLRHGRGVPMRSDIDPRGIENALEYAFILEKIAPGLARIRIAGMHLSDVMGMEVRGMPISSFLPPDGRNRFGETLEHITTGPAIARLLLSAETGIGKPPLDARMVLLPLRSDFGDISRVLGCFESHGQIGRAPRRFNVLGTELIDIEEDVRAPTIPQDLSPHTQKHPATQGFAEPQARFETKRSGATARTGYPSYLKLVKSDD